MCEFRQSASGWKATTLGELTTEQSLRVGSISPPPTVLSSTKHFGLVPSDEYFKNRQIYSDDLTNYKRVQRDWFAYATNHLAEGSIGRQKQFDDSCVSPIYTVFSCAEGVYPPYLERVLKSESVVGQYKTREQATVDRRGAVRYRDFARARVDLPPKVEQVKIAEILDTFDSTIRRTEAIVEKLKQAKRGLLHDLLTRGINANGELRPPQSESPHLYKVSPLGWIPVEWATLTLGELATNSVIGPFGSDLVAADYRSEGVPVVFVRDVKADRFEWKSNVFVSATKALALSAHEVRPGDVIATKMGVPPCIAAVYPESMPNGIVTADIVRLRFDTEFVRPGWVSLSINESAVTKQVEQITAGVTRPKVTLRDVRKLEVRFPPLSEQDRILGCMNSLDQRIESESTTLLKLNMEKVGLVDDLLTGRVRTTPLLT